MQWHGTNLSKIAISTNLEVDHTNSWHIGKRSRSLIVGRYKMAYCLEENKLLIFIETKSKWFTLEGI